MPVHLVNFGNVGILFGILLSWFYWVIAKNLLLALFLLSFTGKISGYHLILNKVTTVLNRVYKCASDTCFFLK